MNRRLLLGLGLGLGITLSFARAEEIQWRPAGALPSVSSPSTPSPAAVLGRPEPMKKNAPAPSSPVVSLGRPIPANSGTDMPQEIGSPLGTGVVLTSFTPVAEHIGRSLTRAQNIDDLRPMPSGPQQVGAPLSPPSAPTERLVPQPGGSVASPSVPSAGPQIEVPAMPTAPPEGSCDFGGCVGDACSPCCESPCCSDCGCCVWDPSIFWVRGEYLLWNIRDRHFPPLVTTGPQSSLGIIGLPGTSVLFGGTTSMNDLSGGRLTIGGWIDPCHYFGMEGSVFTLGARSNQFSAASLGDPVLARPIQSAFTGAEGIEQVANLQQVINGQLILPLTGQVTVDYSSALYGTDINGLFHLWEGPVSSWTLLAGYRYANLYESVGIREDLLVPVTAATIAAGQAGVSFVVADRFASVNQFNGGQIGLRSEWFWRRWRLDMTSKLAIGSTHQVVDIVGSTAITPPGGPTTNSPGGLLAQPFTNMGRYTQEQFTVIPEFGVNLNYELTRNWRAVMGYNFLYWSSVARPEDQIDRRINVTQLPRLGNAGQPPIGPALPAFDFKETYFWAQGATAGLEFRY